MNYLHLFDSYLLLHIYLYLPLFSDKYHLQATSKYTHQCCGPTFTGDKNKILDSHFKQELFGVWVILGDWPGLHFLEYHDETYYDHGLIEAVKCENYAMVFCCHHLTDRHSPMCSGLAPGLVF